MRGVKKKTLYKSPYRHSVFLLPHSQIMSVSDVIAAVVVVSCLRSHQAADMLYKSVDIELRVSEVYMCAYGRIKVFLANG